MKKLYFIIIVLCLFSEIKAERIDFSDGICKDIGTTSGAKISLDSIFTKGKGPSLAWQWKKEEQKLVFSVPEILNKALETRRGGLTMWIYNNTALKSPLKIKFEDEDGSIPYYFDFNLDFSGWRACWISFANMQGDHGKKKLKSWIIESPIGVKKGYLLFSRIDFPQQGVHHQATPDFQLPKNNRLPTRELWHWCRLYEWENNPYDIPLISNVDNNVKKDLETVAARLDKMLVPPGRKVNINKATEIYKQAGIHKVKGRWIGAPLLSKDECDKKAGELTLNDVETMLYQFACDWKYNGNESSRKAFFDVFDYAIDQGFAWGSGMGTNHHYGYQVRNIYKAAWMMRDELREAHAEGCEIIRTLTYWSALSETRIPYVYGRDELLDSWNTLLLPKVICAILQPDLPEQLRSMQGISRWLSGSLDFTPGTIGGIKTDGTMFHHGGFYPAYSIGAIGTLGVYLELTNKTSFTITAKAASHLKLALQTMRNYSNLRDWGIGISGRHPFDGSISEDAVKTFALLAERGIHAENKNEIDEELAADYLRLKPRSDFYRKRFEEKGIQEAVAPSGFFVYNYGATGIFRRDNWMVTLKGYNSDVWSSEIYVSDNRYGRYQSYGSVQIYANGNPVSAKESGFAENGWDWNRLPGTTTIHLPLEILESPLTGTLMEHSPENFAGSSSLEGMNGIFGMKLQERNRKNFTPSFHARKSVFCFDNRMICLASSISNDNKDFPTETTLFQLALEDKNDTVFYNGKTWDIFPLSKEIKNSADAWLSDTKGNVYYIPAGQDLHISKCEQYSRDNKKKNPTKGNFVSAWLSHGCSPRHAGYEYMVAVQPSGKIIPGYTVLRKDSIAHIVRDDISGIIGFVVFETMNDLQETSVSAITGETLVMMRETGKETCIMSVCDPSLHLEEKAYTTAKPSRPVIKEICLRGKWSLADISPLVTVEYEADRTILKVTCAEGRPVEFGLIKEI